MHGLDRRARYFAAPSGSPPGLLMRTANLGVLQTDFSWATQQEPGFTARVMRPEPCDGPGLISAGAVVRSAPPWRRGVVRRKRSWVRQHVGHAVAVGPFPAPRPQQVDTGDGVGARVEDGTCFHVEIFPHESLRTGCKRGAWRDVRRCTSRREEFRSGLTPTVIEIVSVVNIWG